MSILHTATTSTKPAGGLLRLVPWLILVGGGLLSFGLWYDAHLTNLEKARVEFGFLTDRVAASIDGRVRSHEQVLRGIVGLFDASRDVSREEFRSFVAALRLDERYPGIQGVGFARLIQPAELARHVAAIRAEGFPEYRLRPGGERPTYTAIVYLEPFDWRNQRAFGYDMYSEPVRQTAMARARDTGKAALSGKVVLVQETDRDVQAGVLLYMPVFAHDGKAAGDPALVGWAYSPLRMDDLMRSLLKAQHPELAGRIALAIHDGSGSDAASLLFESAPLPPTGLRATRLLTLAGRPWTVTAVALPGFDVPESGAARAMLVAELGITLLIALLAGTLVRAHARIGRAMGELADAKRQAEDGERRLRSIYDASTVAIFFVDARGVITFANLRMAEMFGRPLDEIVGGEYVALIHPAEREVGRATVQSLLGGAIAAIDLERRYWRGDHSEFWGHITGRRHGEPGGADFGLVGVIADVTERRNAESELLRYRLHLEELVRSRTGELAAARDAAEAANRAKSAFLAKMGHELRTPMNGIMGMTSIALRRAAEPAQADQLRKALASAGHLLALIDAILEMSRIEAGGLVLEEAGFAPAQVVADACAEHEDAARAKGLRLRQAIAGDLPARLRGDARRLRLVVASFVGNAVKFSERGEIEVRLAVTGRTESELVLRVEVADQGIGIGAEQQGRIFEAFVQGDDSMTRKYGGSGLGLSLSRRIARLMGGDVGVESEPGVGSTFWAEFRLRLEEPDPPA